MKSKCCESVEAGEREKSFREHDEGGAFVSSKNEIKECKERVCMCFSDNDLGVCVC